MGGAGFGGGVFFKEVADFEIEDVMIKRQFIENVLARTTSSGVIRGDFFDAGDRENAVAFCELHLGAVPEYLTENNIAVH